MRFGAQLGLSSASVYDAPGTRDVHWRTGGVIGLAASTRVHTNLELDTGIRYIGKGYQEDKVYNVNRWVTPELTLHYVEVPVLARLRIPLAPKHTLHFVGGLAAGYLVRASKVEQYSPSFDATDSYTRSDFSGIVGMGYRYEGSGAMVGLMVAYAHSFTKVERTSVIPDSDELIENRALLFVIEFFPMSFAR